MVSAAKAAPTKLAMKRIVVVARILSVVEKPGFGVKIYEVVVVVTVLFEVAVVVIDDILSRSLEKDHAGYL